MRKVITYGTFDLFHDGHRRLLERAKCLGDHLTVGVTTHNYDAARGKLNVKQSLMERIKNVEASGVADEIIVEEYEGQKVNDIQRLDIDVFAIGSDWRGKFDYLQDYCQVVYLERTEGISSTALRESHFGITKLGIVGSGRIANRFISEARFVSGIHVEGVCSRRMASAIAFQEIHHLNLATADFNKLIEEVDAVYIATPHEYHYTYALSALQAGVHVLCEKPLALKATEAQQLYDVAKAKNVVLLEAIKTAYSTGFQRMIAVARSGSIGQIKSVDATFTKLENGERELSGESGGSISELASYPLLAIVKLLGLDFSDIRTYALVSEHSPVDTFARIDLLYPRAIASARVGLGVKAEGDLVVAGTEGYLYVPSPWWKTEYFELRFEDTRRNKKFYYKFDGDGLRYELAEFGRLINERLTESFTLNSAESVSICSIIEKARSERMVIA